MDFLSLFRKILSILRLKYCHISPSVSFPFLKKCLAAVCLACKFNAYRLTGMRLEPIIALAPYVYSSPQKFSSILFVILLKNNYSQGAFEFQLEIFVLKKPFSNISVTFLVAALC